MQLFLKKDLDITAKQIQLDEPTSKHLIQVLRMKIGEKIAITNGKGVHAEVELIDDNRKRVVVNLLKNKFVAADNPQLNMAVCFTKNKSRNEWMLEKLTELGVTEITPLIAQRSEKERWNRERMETIIESAMIQSQQCHLPHLADPIILSKFMETKSTQYANLLVAHCEADSDKQTIPAIITPFENTCILIGPEGDFTAAEVQLIKDKSGKAVTLGNTRLRTETAAIYACSIFNAFKHDNIH